MVPDPLQRVELGRIGRQVEDFHVFSVVGKPQPNGFVFVVRGIVLDQIDLARIVTAQRSFQILDIGLGVEDLLEVVQEPGRLKLDGTEDF